MQVERGQGQTEGRLQRPRGKGHSAGWSPAVEPRGDFNPHIIYTDFTESSSGDGVLVAPSH